MQRRNDNGTFGTKISPQPLPVSVTSHLGLSETDLRAKHDNMYKIREGVKGLKKGYYFTDQQMREKCHVSTNVWRSYAESQEFEQYRLKLGDIIYWGIPACIAKLREDLNVS